MPDLLGPADAGAINTLTTTGDVTAPIAGDTWYQDCIGGVSGTGTNEVAKYINRMLQQERVAIRMSGVPLSNAYDNMLSWAIQSGYANWIGTAGGTANALTGSVGNTPLTVLPGTIIRGLASTPNTGPAEFNFQGTGLLPITLCDGAALVGGEIDGAFAVMWTGAAWVLLSPVPVSNLLGIIYQENVQTFLSSGTWTAPAGFVPESRVIIEIWAAGAGGSDGRGGGGGAYERFETYLGNLPGSCSVIIGAGGIGVPNSAMAGYPADVAAGGSSTFAYGLYSNTFTAAGGGNLVAVDNSDSGASNLVPNAMGNGGAGGFTGSLNGDNAPFGGGGGAGYISSSSFGTAGTSVFGGAGGAPGANGSVPGGGGGGSNGSTVGNGAGGQVVVTTLQG